MLLPTLRDFQELKKLEGTRKNPEGPQKMVSWELLRSLACTADLLIRPLDLPMAQARRA